MIIHIRKREDFLSVQQAWHNRDKRAVLSTQSSLNILNYLSSWKRITSVPQQANTLLLALLFGMHNYAREQRRIKVSRYSFFAEPDARRV